MNFKTSYVLFAILALLLLVLGIALYLDPLPEDASGYLFPSANVEDGSYKWENIDRVEIQRDGKKFVLSKDVKKDRWYIVEPFKAEAYRINVEQLVRQAIEAKVDKDAKLPAAKDLGLEPPKAVITLKEGDKRSFELKIGDQRPGTNTAGIYVISSETNGEPRVVSKSGLSAALEPLLAFRGRDMLSSSPGDLKTVTLTQREKAEGEEKTKESKIRFVAQGERWYYTEPFEAEADTITPAEVTPEGEPPNGMKKLLDDISNVRVDFTSMKENGFVASDVKASDLGKYNLGENDPVVTIAVERKEQDGSVTERAVHVGIGKKLEPGEEGGGPSMYYAKVTDGTLKFSNRIVKVEATYIDPAVALLDNPAALRDRHLVRLDGEKTPNVIRIKNPSGTLEFFRPDPTRPWVLYQGDKKLKVDDQRVVGLLSLLNQDKQVASFVKEGTDPATLGLQNPIATVEFWSDGIEEPKEEKKDDKNDDGKEDKKEEEKKEQKPKLKHPDEPDTKLEFGNWEKSKDVVVVRRKVKREGTTLLRAKEVIFERISDSALVYLDRKLPEYNPGTLDSTLDVTKLELVRHGKEKIVVVRGEKPEVKMGELPPPTTWVVKEPASLKDRKADSIWVEGILNKLNRASVVRYIDDKPTKEDLKTKYGLEPPRDRASVTITRDDKSEVFSFDYGKEVKGQGVYGRQSGAFDGGIIYLIEKSIVEDMQKDPCDKQILEFEPDKVRSVRFMGWKGHTKNGFPATISFKSEDGSTFEVDKITGGMLKEKLTWDSDKVRSFMSQVSKLYADDFVSHGENPKADQQIRPPDGGLQVTIKLEGREKPIVLQIGKQDGAKGHFVTASTVPGDIFYMLPFVFEGPKGNPDHFAKKE